MSEKTGGIRVTDEAGHEAPVQLAGNTVTFRAKNHALYRVRLNA